ncbi:hypothetical protein ACFP3U_15640 [Kitasatospora misakiensis]|uniref:Uncharacterized protein n=1 Tax=Kitasatospora misakiensis TaxID=67330 RepID=A0ABW0X3S4_9ACTN
MGGEEAGRQEAHSLTEALRRLDTADAVARHHSAQLVRRTGQQPPLAFRPRAAGVAGGPPVLLLLFSLPG